MKKSTKNLLIMGAVLLVLGAAAALLWLLPAGSEEEEPSSAVSSDISSAVKEAALTELTAADVTAISVKNAEDSYAFVSDGNEFVLQGYEEYDINSVSVASATQALLSMTPSKSLGSRDDPENFGLSGKDAVQVEIACQDGSKVKLTLGSEAGESTGRYVQKDNEVYIVSNVPDLLYAGKFDYFSTFLYSIADRTQSITDESGSTSIDTLPDILYKLHLSGTHFPEDVHIEYSGEVLSAFLMTAPVRAESGNNGLDDVAAALKAPAAIGVAAAGLTEEVLEEYGLLEPFAKAEFTLNTDSHTVTVSELDGNNNRYLLLDDRDVVYKVSQSEVAAWAETNAMKLRMSYIWLANINDVEHITLTAEGDMVYRFDITREVDEERSTEENTQYDLFVKNAAGNDIPYKNYQKFYQKLIAVAVMSIDRPSGNDEDNGSDVIFGGFIGETSAPLLRVEYSYFESSAKNTVEFYAIENDRCVAVLDGEFNGVVRKSEVDKLIAQLAELNG